jgi:5-methylcytosine-specific restriction endonuclease McrA
VAELRYKVQFTADQAYVDLLEEARNLLQHQLPTRDLVEVQRRALELLVHKLRQRKYAASERPGPKAPEPVNGTPQAQPTPQSTPARPRVPQVATRAPHSTNHARHSAPPAPQSEIHPHQSASRSANQSRDIPAEVRRSVWKRDEARCAYVDARGQRCREQAGLEFHHQHPHARCGPGTIDNLALRCRSHNALAAEQDFGRDVIRKKRARRATLAETTRTGAAP